MRICNTAQSWPKTCRNYIQMCLTKLGTCYWTSDVPFKMSHKISLQHFCRILCRMRAHLVFGALCVKCGWILWAWVTLLRSGTHRCMSAMWVIWLCPWHGSSLTLASVTLNGCSVWWVFNSVLANQVVLIATAYMDTHKAHLEKNWELAHTACNLLSCACIRPCICMGYSHWMVCAFITWLKGCSDRFGDSHIFIHMSGMWAHILDTRNFCTDEYWNLHAAHSTAVHVRCS